MFYIVVTCVSFFCVNVGLPDTSKGYSTMAECQQALVILARAWKPIIASDHSYVWNCVQR